MLVLHSLLFLVYFSMFLTHLYAKIALKTREIIVKYLKNFAPSGAHSR